MNKLREIRKRSGMTQQAVADYLSVDRSSVTNWECGKYDPNNTTLIKLANLFGTTVDELLGVEIKKPDFSVEEKQLLDNFRKLNVAGKTAALGVVNAYTLISMYTKKDNQ